jgi:hypothetical protein
MAFFRFFLLTSAFSRLVSCGDGGLMRVTLFVGA